MNKAKEAAPEVLCKTIDALIEAYGVALFSTALLRVVDDRVEATATEEHDVTLSKHWAMVANAAVDFEKHVLREFT